MKVALLVAITSAGRGEELCVLMSWPFYIVFFEGPGLPTSSQVVPKVVSTFHDIQPVYLFSLFLKPHTNREELCLLFLDIRRALVFYLDKTKQFRKAFQLFVVIADKMKG